MKKKILTLFVFLSVTLASYAQKASVEESTSGIQTGVLGVWAHNEYQLSRSIALRSELGLDAGLFGGTSYDGIGYIFAPIITLESRWYYNLNKRLRKGKSIANNSGNFISIKTSHLLDWVVLSNNDNVSVDSNFSVIPTWSIRRTVGHFTYEVGLGIGYRYYFDYGGEATANLNLRIGYTF